VVVGALALMCCGFVFLAARWRAMIVQHERMRVLPMTALLVIGQLLNYALPGPVGEFAAAALAGRRYGIPAEMAFAASVHARLIGLVMAGAVAGGLALLVEMPAPEGTGRWIAAAGGFLAFTAAMLAVLSARPAWVRRGVDLTLGRVRRLGGVADSVRRFADSMQAVGRLGPRRYAEGALWALAGHACVLGGIRLAAMGLDVAPNIAGLCFTYASSTAGAALVFAFPGGQVGWDAIFSALLVTAAGVSLPDALALTLVVRVQQLLMVLAGAVALPLWFRGTDGGEAAGG
jgi:hypothetical protein